MNLTDSVLVVVDMQNGFVRQESAQVVPAVINLTRRWQAAGGASIFTRFVNSAGSPFERLIHWTKVATSPEIDIVEGLQPYAARGNVVVDKPGYTMFTPRGEQVIASVGWRNLVICGLATESCVCKTAVDAFERDLTPWVVTNACGSHGGHRAHEAGLLVTERFIGSGQLITSADLDPLLGSPAAHRTLTG